MTYFITFFQSNILEWPIYFVCLQRLSVAKRAIFITAMNSITHPIVFFVLMTLPYSRLQNILVAEAFAIGVETFILSGFQKMTLARSLLFASLANLISWQLGPILTYYLWMGI